jgi:hypothetical protein
VRWKPANFDDLQANQNTCDAEMFDTLDEVFGKYIGSINIIQWDDVTKSNKTTLEQASHAGSIQTVPFSSNHHPDELRTVYLWYPD